MIKKLLLGTSLVASLALAGQASALTYTSKIEHIDANLSVDGNYGLVTIEEMLGGKDLLITVDLNAPLTGIVDNGKAHIAFAFNLIDSPNSTISVLDPAGGGSFTYLGENSFTQSPFGSFTNGFSCCGPSLSEPPPFVFKISNASGITFAGLGATFDIDGRLLTTGTGNRLASNAGGWWFAADTTDGRNTGAKAARDAFVGVAAPEPGTWALMIMGFGGAGAMLRRRRDVLAAV